MAKASAGVTKTRPKSKDKKDGKGDEKAVETPSQFGSHASMTNEELTGKIAEARQDANDPWVVLTDERGNYATRRSLLDSGLTDANRCPDQPVREERVAELTAG